MLARISAELPEAPMRGFFRAVMKRQGSRDARPRSGLTLTRDRTRTLSRKGQGSLAPLPSGERQKGVQGACSLLGAAGQTAPRTPSESTGI